MRKVFCLFLLLGSAWGLSAQEAAVPAAKAAAVVVTVATSMGNFDLELYPDKAPATVANFLEYVTAKHYDGTIFHRVEPNFVIQGGNQTPAGESRSTRPSIKNEADNGLANARLTVAMARTQDPDSAADQFYINLKDNTNLNHREKTRAGWGYCVFGKVIGGEDVVQRIGQVKLHPYRRAVPAEPVVIQSIRRKEAAPAATNQAERGEAPKR